MTAEPIRVLLVEDNPGDARLLREALVDAGPGQFALTHVERLADALTRLKDQGADVVLLDLSLPDGHGLDTVVRLLKEAPSVPIVVLTGLDDETLAVKAVQIGAQDYLVKGQVEGNLFIRAMRYAIERKRAQEALRRAHDILEQRVQERTAELARANEALRLEIAERKQMEAARAQLLVRERAARAEAEKLAAERAAILQHIADAVVIADPTGRISFVNEAARRLGLAVSPDDVVADARAVLARALDGAAVVDAEIRLRRADGRDLVLQGSATPVIAEDGTHLGAVLTLHDVTAQRELERQKDEFIANISHDLRTPITAIKASIGVVLANEPPNTPEPLHRMLVNIDLAADRMAKLVADLLELKRLQAGRVQLELSQCDLRELAHRSVRTIEPLAQARGQRIVLELPPHPVPALVDAERFERALLNLLGNAQKYGRVGGTIRLRVVQRSDEILLAVADDGPGIAEADQEHIFERFFRSEKEGSTHQGSGLGLPIARAMVELHGGRIWVESKLGHGATFWIALPAPAPAHTKQKDGSR